MHAFVKKKCSVLGKEKKIKGGKPLGKRREKRYEVGAMMFIPKDRREQSSDS